MRTTHRTLTVAIKSLIELNYLPPPAAVVRLWNSINWYTSASKYECWHRINWIERSAWTPQTTADQIIWALRLSQTTFYSLFSTTDQMSRAWMSPQTKSVASLLPQTTADHYRPNVSGPETPQTKYFGPYNYHRPHFTHFLVPQTKWVRPECHHRPNL